MRRAALFAFVLAPSLAALAAADRIDDYVAAEMKHQHIPGLALGIYLRGEIVRARGYGLANVELDVPVKPQTIFQSGSVGKQFAATAIMMLVEEGKINLDDSITKYFDGAPSTWKPVQVKNLLSHTSGLAEYETGARTRPGGPFYLRLDCPEPELFDKIAALPMDFQPGEKWRYTNTNYVLLGMMIRKVTGRFYGDFLADRIFHPLGMTATRIISERDIVPNRAAGYEWVNGEIKNQEWVSPSYNSTADGALYFNVLDLARWDAALYTEQLVRKASLDRMWTVFPLNCGQANPGHYGFAWSLSRQNGHRLIEHGGAWQGFTTHIARYVDDGLTVVVLANLDAAHARAGRIAHQVAALENPALAVPEARPIEDTEPARTALVRTLLEHIAAGTADPASFTPEARKFFFPDRIAEVAAFLKDQGAPQTIEVMERRDDGGEPARRYRLTSAHGRSIFNLRFGPDNRIAALRFEPE